MACDVCGRTLLRGERADPYIAGGSRRMVCELCAARAANEGWIREGADNSLAVRRNGGRGGRSFLERLRPRKDVAAPGTVEEDVGPRRSRHERVERVREHDGAELVPGGAEAYEPEATAQPDQAAVEHHDPAREPRHVHAVPTNADLKMERSLEVFNKSPHPRRVAGVARSLGTPAITVLASETEGSIVWVIVAWELCWYRYEVDLADEASGVRVIAQGAELSELADAERQPNAAADERGLLALAG